MVAVPYLIYMPEKDRLLMLVNCDYPHHAEVLFSDDRGASWSSPKPAITGTDGKPVVGMGTSLCYLREGNVLFYGSALWFSRDHGQTWDLDHKYILHRWIGHIKDGPTAWYPSSQATSTVLLPDGSILTAFGTGCRCQRRSCPAMTWLCILVGLGCFQNRLAQRPAQGPMSPVPQTPEGMGYELVWQDDFNGNALDPKKWEVRGVGPRALGFVSPEAVTVGDGYLKVRSRAGGWPGTSGLSPASSWGYPRFRGLAETLIPKLHKRGIRAGAFGFTDRRRSYRGGADQTLIMSVWKEYVRLGADILFVDEESGSGGLDVPASCLSHCDELRTAFKLPVGLFLYGPASQAGQVREYASHVDVIGEMGYTLFLEAHGDYGLEDVTCKWSAAAPSSGGNASVSGRWPATLRATSARRWPPARMGSFFTASAACLACRRKLRRKPRRS